MRRMRLAQKNKIYLITFLLVLTTFIRYEYGSGNPIPFDDNWEVSPYPYNYNGSISFVEEYINVTFDKTKANIIATYTFENLNDTTCNATILIPYLNYFNKSNRPIISHLLLDEYNTSYEWMGLTENFSTIYPYNVLPNEYYLVKIKIPFEANETKVVEIHYTRNYRVYDYYFNYEIHYSYRYFVGSARLWNHSIESARFDFWIPKTRCDKISLPGHSNYLGNNISNLIEYDNYYFVSVKYENWTLPIDDDGKPLKNHSWDFVNIYWTQRKPFYRLPFVQEFFFFAIIPGIGITSLVIIIRKKITKKQKEYKQREEKNTI